MVVKVIVYIVLCVVCCVIVLHVVSHCCSSYCHACHVLCLRFLYMLVLYYMTFVMSLDSIASGFLQVLLLETFLSISF